MGDSLDTELGDDFDTFRIRLHQTMRWARNLPKHGSHGVLLRTEALRPAVSVHEQPWEAVKAVAQNRVELMGPPDVSVTFREQQGWPPLELAPIDSQATHLGGGRLLVYFPEDNLQDGAAEVSSRGFFEEWNLPPWDLWVAFFCEGPPPRRRFPGRTRYLVAWVPLELEPLATRGIMANPEACIIWIDDFDGPVRRMLRESGILP
jgi:hypothetical protein